MAARSAQETWIDDKARRAGYADGAAFARPHGLKNYRLQQLYRARPKSWLPMLLRSACCRKDLLAAMAAESFGGDAVEPVASSTPHAASRRTPSPHHDLDGRHRAADRAVRRRRRAGEPRDLAARPTDDIRSSIMPVNRKWPLAKLMDSVSRYMAKGNRKVVEYVMLDGVNDRPPDAEALAHLLCGRLYHLNVIPNNSTPDARLGSSGDQRIRAFTAILEPKASPARCASQWAATSPPPAVNCAERSNAREW